MFARFVLIATAIVTAVAAAEFRARLWPSAEKTQLIIETPQPVEYRILRLQNPDRLVLDIVDDKNSIDFLHRADLHHANYLNVLRVARHNDNTLRLVFEINDSINYEVRAIPPVAGFAHRLVLDISPQQFSDPLGALIESLRDSQQKAQPDFIVVIDPGHGGEDPGAVSPNGNYEKNIVLAVARKLKNEIDRRPGMRAVLTRDDDRFLPLVRRVLIAHRLQADAFISVHADSVESRRPRGSSVFVLSERGASSKLARRLAKNENLSDIIGGGGGIDPQLNQALPAFFKDGKDRASRQLGKLVLKEMGDINSLHKPHVEAAGFAVLKSPSILSILVETAFISNPEEEKKLLSDVFQNKMAKAIADGLQQYREQYEVRE